MLINVRKRAIVSNIILITIAGFLLLLGSNSNAAEPFGTYLGEFSGVAAYSNGNTSYYSDVSNYVNGTYTGIQWQCVEYVRRYYLLVYGIDLASMHLGDANTWYDNASAMGLERYPNGSSTSPQVGDILVSEGGDYGHVAIVKSVSGSQVCTIQQNFSNDSTDVNRCLTLAVSGGNYTVGGFSATYPIEGWLRIPLTILYAGLFRDILGPNSIGWTPGDRLSVSAQVEPVNTSYGQTVVTATNLDTGYSMQLGYIGGIPPNEFGKKIAYDPALTGAWLITATNGPYTATALTNEIGDVGPMPFLRNVQILGTGLTPTISWTLPANSGAGYIHLNIIDAVTGLRIWWSPHLDITTTEYTIDDGVLVADHPYIIRVFLNNEDGTSRSTSFYDFTPLEEGEPDTVFIPTVGQDPDPTDEFGAAFMFDIDVEEGVPCFIDPFVAVGYDYEIGIEDTVKFASVTLPEVGDNLFDLYLFDDTDFYLARKDLGSGETYNFGPEGVDQFRILGIEEGAELDPLDATAFITELTFTETGQFTGNMTPIISIDNDSDGILDYQDNCVNSDLSSTVVIGDCDSGVFNTLLPTGCTITDRIAECAAGVKNHGKFISCVAHLTNALKKDGVITGKEKGAIESCAAQANIP